MMPAPDRPLTATQLKLLRVIYDVARDTGVPPTVREMAPFMGFGRRGVHWQLARLRRQGLLLGRGLAGKSRAWALIRTGKDAIGAPDFAAVTLRDKARGFLVRLGARCRCGAFTFRDCCPVCRRHVGAKHTERMR